MLIVKCTTWEEYRCYRKNNTCTNDCTRDIFINTHLKKGQYKTVVDSYNSRDRTLKTVKKKTWQFLVTDNTPVCGWRLESTDILLLMSYRGNMDSRFSFIQDFPVILKHPLHNYWKILNKCTYWCKNNFMNFLYLSGKGSFRLFLKILKRKCTFSSSTNESGIHIVWKTY